MKKILTLMVMFAMTAGILSTQAQSLSYQVVVRDVNNNLVVNQELTVRVAIKSGDVSYYEVITAKTNLNGMLSLTIGNSETSDGTLSNIKWDNATIAVDFQNSNIPDVAEEIVRPVPYALQADFLLTTQQIVDYIGSVQVNADINDWARIYNALRANEPFFNAIRDTVVNYVKANYPIAKSIALHYLSKINANDVKEAYDTLNVVLNSKPGLNTLKDVIMDYVRNHRAMAFELAEYYAQHATERDVKKLYKAVRKNDSVVDPIMDSVLIVFLKEFGLDPACLTDNNYTYCQFLDAVSNSGSITPCVGITKVQNSVKDGLLALYENRGVIYTAYIKNFAYFAGNNFQYGFEQSENANFSDKEVFSATYHAITNRFGKFDYTMDNTATCGTTLYVRAYATFVDSCDNNRPTVTIYSEPMTVVIPGFTVSIEKDGNTLKAKFDSQEATDAFNIKKSNVVWKDNNTGAELGRGLTYEIPTNANITSIKVTAHLGQCEDTAIFPQQ